MKDDRWLSGFAGATLLYLLLYVVARKLDLIPQLVAPCLDAVTGVLVLASIPLLPWAIMGLPFAPLAMLILIAELIGGTNAGEGARREDREG